jgi:hypothetical protein
MAANFSNLAEAIARSFSATAMRLLITSRSVASLFDAVKPQAPFPPLLTLEQVGLTSDC